MTMTYEAYRYMIYPEPWSKQLKTYNFTNKMINTCDVDFQNDAFNVIMLIQQYITAEWYYFKLDITDWIIQQSGPLQLEPVYIDVA